MIEREFTKLKDSLTKLVVHIIILTYLAVTKMGELSKIKKSGIKDLIQTDKYISNYTCKKWIGLSSYVMQALPRHKMRAGYMLTRSL